MPFESALYALLHVLVFVYWLGGDLGAFYSSRFLIADGISPDRRLMAAKIVGDVDMAPRTALIMALPTGLVLAISKGWIGLPMSVGWAALGMGAAWLALAWKLHLSHGAAPASLKTLDLGIRWLVLFGLAAWGVAGLVGYADLPTFIALKLILLAGAILMGLLIRRTLQPLGPALAGLTGETSADAEASLAATLNAARPLVVVIWALILSAAFLGLWAPTSF